MCKYIAYNEEHGAYLCRDGTQWHAVTDRARATEETFKKLHNVITNQKSVRATPGIWKCVPVEQKSIPRADCISEPVSCVTSDYVGELPRSEIAVEQPNTLSIPKDLLDAMVSFRTVFSQENYDTLKQLMQEVDQEVVDLYHAIEFSNYNAYQGYLAYKELKNTLTRRREIKMRIDVFASIMGGSNDVDKLIKKNHEQHYVPRVREELFK